MNEYTAIIIDSDGYITRIVSTLADNKTRAADQIIEYLSENPSRLLTLNVWVARGAVIVLTRQLA